MTYTAEQVRARFEAWVSTQSWFSATLGLVSAGTGEGYADPCINSRWQGWMAASVPMLLERRAEGVTDAVRVAGAMLANCAFNLAQCDRLTTRERQSLDASRKVWDAAIATMPVAAEPAQPDESAVDRLSQYLKSQSGYRCLNDVARRDIARDFLAVVNPPAPAEPALDKACRDYAEEIGTNGKPTGYVVFEPAQPADSERVGDTAVRALLAKWTAELPGRDERYGNRECSAEAGMLEYCIDGLEAALAAQGQSASPAGVPERLARSGLAGLMIEVIPALRAHGSHDSLIADIETLLAAAPSAQESQSNG